MAEDEWALPRAKELAQMVFGEDLAEAAGDTLDRNWLHVSSSAHCGKMAALEQLLHLWAAAGDNKVHSPLPMSTQETPSHACNGASVTPDINILANHHSRPSSSVAEICTVFYAQHSQSSRLLFLLLHTLGFAIPCDLHGGNMHL